MRHLLATFLAIPLTAAIALVGVQPAYAATAHVGPGQSIQAAITAASPGDTIVVAAGTYRENLTITKDRIKLRGAGAGRTILKPATVPNPSPCTFSPSSVNGICSVRNTGTNIEGFTVAEFSGFGILFFQAADLTVARSEARKNGSYGISGFVLSGVRFLNNTARDNGEPGFYIGDSPNANATVTGNTAFNNGVGGPEGFGILIRDASNGVVRNNNVWGNCAGIVFANTGAPGGVENWVASGNRVSKNNGPCTGESGGPPPTSGIGIWLLGTNNVRVHHNAVNGNVPSGITAASGGIVVSSSAALGGSPPTNNRVDGNSAHENSVDIFWDETGSNNTFKHNDCDRSQPAWICSEGNDDEGDDSNGDNGHND